MNTLWLSGKKDSSFSEATFNVWFCKRINYWFSNKLSNWWNVGKIKILVIRSQYDQDFDLANDWIQVNGAFWVDWKLLHPTLLCVVCGWIVITFMPWSLLYITTSKPNGDSWLSRVTKKRFSLDQSFSFWICLSVSKKGTDVIRPESLCYLQVPQLGKPHLGVFWRKCRFVVTRSHGCLWWQRKLHGTHLHRYDLVNLFR